MQTHRAFRLESKRSFQRAIAASSRPCYFSDDILPRPDGADEAF
jgi:hypothetical protein